MYWCQYVRVMRRDGTVHEYGPYWYSWYYDDRGLRRKRYHGRADPRRAGDDVPAGALPVRPPFDSDQGPNKPPPQEVS